MPRTFEMDGDRWITTVDRQAAHPGMHAVVFHCVTDGQRPYRVLEVPAERNFDPDGKDLTEGELRELFSNAHTMDYSHDEAAEPLEHGYGDRHL
jgi:hypothetical protein